MNKTIKTLMIGAAAVVAAPQAAQAANWFALQGNEAPGTAAPVTVWGFLQPAFEYSSADPVSGATPASGFNGRDPVFNKTAPDQTSASSFFLRRARIGVHGVMSPLDERINYFIMAEFGKNGITREDAVALTDASVTLNYIPGARIRLGQFKLPIAEEALQSVPVVYAYNNFTNVLDSLVLERFMVANGAGQAGNTFAPPPAGTVGGNVVGSTSAFRDIGIQAYDWFTMGKMEYAYAAMLSNGNGINNTDNNGDRDITGRLQASYIFGGAGAFREDLTGWVWRQQGTRTFEANNYRRVREGLGFRYWKKPLRVSGEYMRGKGMIFTGLNPPFNDLAPGAATNTLALGTENKADGWYLEAGYFVMPKLELDLRYDTFDRLTNNAALEREFTTWTVGTQYHFSPKARVTLNYEFRDQEVSNPGALAAGPRQNAQAIADALGDRFSAQVNFIF